MSKRRGHRWTRCPQCSWTGPDFELTNHKRIHKEQTMVARATELAKVLAEPMLSRSANTESLIEHAVVLCDELGTDKQRVELHLLLRWSATKMRQALYEQIGYRALESWFWYTTGWRYSNFYVHGDFSGFEPGMKVLIGDPTPDSWSVSFNIKETEGAAMTRFYVDQSRSEGE